MFFVFIILSKSRDFVFLMIILLRIVDEKVGIMFLCFLMFLIFFLKKVLVFLR